MVVFDELEKLGLRSGPKFVVKFVLIFFKFVLFQNSFELQRNYEKTSIVVLSVNCRKGGQKFEGD